MTSYPTVSIVLGTFNRLRFLKATIASVRAELGRAPVSAEIIVVDGGSTDGSLRWLMEQKDIVTIVQHNRGHWRGKAVERRSWGYFMNLGFKCAQGKYVCMLSDDCLVVPGAIRNGVALFEERIAGGEKVGAVAFYWRNWPEDDRYQVGLTLSDKMTVNHGLYLNDALKDVGYIDEGFHFYYADGDLCLKMWRQGYTVIDSKDSYIEHYSHANLKVRSSNLEKEREDWRHYLEKWDGIYYGREGQGSGGRLLRSFQDRQNLARQFDWADRWKGYARRSMGKLLSCLRIWRLILRRERVPMKDISFRAVLGFSYHYLRNAIHQALESSKPKVCSTAIVERRKLVRLDRYCEIKDHVIIRTFANPVVVGAYSQINPFTVIYGGSGVYIGNNVMIAPHCMIASGNHDFKQVEVPTRFAGSLTKGPIVIEDNVWIGANCTITDGVKIGRDAVVAANSVVTRDVAPYDIVAGVPAKVLGNRLENAKETARVQ